ncbi:unnamed protein product [Linum trigynum]|uniref:Reverse transcriptase n=1 Tax=Linum trigynum TaxID=586398 RepID=A0AAV2FY36_9ROSI
MGTRKASGSDGLTVLFYRWYWRIIGDDVVKAVLGMLETGEIPQGINHTLIALIPKTKKPSRAQEFRPISLCNAIYKLVAKVLANRLKMVLDHVISP